MEGEYLSDIDDITAVIKDLIIYLLRIQRLYPNLPNIDDVIEDLMKIVKR